MLFGELLKAVRSECGDPHTGLGLLQARGDTPTRRAELSSVESGDQLPFSNDFTFVDEHFGHEPWTFEAELTRPTASHCSAEDAAHLVAVELTDLQGLHMKGRGFSSGVALRGVAAAHREGDEAGSGNEDGRRNGLADRFDCKHAFPSGAGARFDVNPGLIGSLKT